jgi:hypothetical protein
MRGKMGNLRFAYIFNSANHIHGVSITVASANFLGGIGGKKITPNFNFLHPFSQFLKSFKFNLHAFKTFIGSDRKKALNLQQGCRANVVC